jgi:hypothetical protein
MLTERPLLLLVGDGGILTGDTCTYNEFLYKLSRPFDADLLASGSS